MTTFKYWMYPIAIFAFFAVLMLWGVPRFVDWVLDRNEPKKQKVVVSSDSETRSRAPDPPRRVKKVRPPTPDFVSKEVITASLEALKKHGADLTKPMASTHQVRCETQDAVDLVTRWSKRAEFVPSPPKTIHLHGGIEYFTVDLVRTKVPDVDQIHRYGDLVHVVTIEMPGVTYTSWVGEIVR